MAWLNSDDMYMPWCFRVIGQIFGQNRGRVHWLTGLPGRWHANGALVRVGQDKHYSRRLIALGAYRAGGLGSIQQESTFWSRELWEKAGGRVDSELQLAGDFELWQRFAEHVDLYVVLTAISGLREHDERRAVRGRERYNAEIDHLLQDRRGMWLRKCLELKLVRRLVHCLLTVFRMGWKRIYYDLSSGKWVVYRSFGRGIQTRFSER